MSAAPIEQALLTAAVRYASRGYPVFPCHHPTPSGGCSCGDVACGNIGKHPRTINGLKNATTDEDQVRAWWAKWPDANIGLRCGGQERLVILDVDDPDAATTLPAPLPATYTTQTGRNGGSGRHYWYRLPDGVTLTNSRGALPDKIDIRGDGGYVIAPPSLHATGERYRVAERRKIAELPAMIVQLTAAAKRASVPPRTPPREWLDQDGTSYGRRALDAETALVARAAEGTRNEQLNRSAFSLGQLVAGGELAEDATVQRLEAAAAACGLPDAEAASTIRRAIADGAQQPRSAPATPPHAPPPAAPASSDDDDLPLIDARRTWHRTDYGNAERLVHYHGRNLRYVAAWRAWLAWAGSRWRRDDDQAVRDAKNTARQIFHEAADEPNEKQQKAITAFAFASEANARIRAMLSMAESEPGVGITPDQLDADPYQLNTPTGTIDLRTGHAQPHRRSDLITKLAPTTYQPAAGADFYQAFLRRIFADDDDLIAFVQRIAGLSILGTTSERILPICYGSGANGKSTLLELWQRVLGDYADAADADALLLTRRDAGANTPELADLHGRRLVVTAETSQGRKLNVARVKAITGGDSIRACRKYENPFTFTPSHTIWLVTNHRPRITDDGDAIWSRVHLIPFNVTFPPAERIPRVELDQRLDQDGPGILNWLVKGASDYLRHGVGEAPASVRVATSSYRQSEDVLGSFLADTTDPSVTENTSSSVLYHAYKAWCDDRGERPGDVRNFAEQMEARGYERHRKDAGVVWLNLELRARKVL
jgi:putative DNA primase/helicase